MAAETGFSEDKYDVYRPKPNLGSQSSLIDLETEIVNRGQAKLCQ
jgi:hypothetical protein